MTTKARWLSILALAWLAMPSSTRAQVGAEGLGAPVPEPAPAVEVAPDPVATEADGAELVPEPEPAPSRQLDAPVAPRLAPRDIAMQLANLELEELALQREADSIGGDRTLSLALYVGGIGLTIGSVAMLVAAVLQGACVSEEFGCFDAPQYIIGGVPVALVGALILSGASMTNARVGIRERALRPRQEAVEEQRRRLERRVGLAIGPGSLQLGIVF